MKREGEEEMKHHGAVAAVAYLIYRPEFLPNSTPAGTSVGGSGSLASRDQLHIGLRQNHAISMVFRCKSRPNTAKKEVSWLLEKTT